LLVQKKTTFSALGYCLVLILLPVIAIPACIQLGRSDFFLHHGASVWVQANDMVFETRNRSCDVVVFGDSTAMTGIDPDRVEEQTGFRTCNIAVTNAVLAVTGNLTLDHFLAHNGKPRVLLVQLSPDGFEPENHAWHQTIYAEGMLELLRHGSPSEARRLLISHPEESIAFAGYAAGFTAWYVIKDIWFHATHLRPEEDRVTVRNGFFTPPSPARTFCAPPPTGISTPTPEHLAYSRSLVADFHANYSDKAGLVLVNVAPIPDCDQNLETYTTELNGVTSNLLLPMPIGYFNDGRHYTARGSQIVSSLVARELNRVANHDPTIEDRLTGARREASLERTELDLKP
jgi:hypothetical protein